jgi:excisionase family DNA binding protein
MAATSRRQAKPPAKPAKPAKGKQRQAKATGPRPLIAIPETPRELETLLSAPVRLGNAVVDPAAQLLTVDEAARLLRIGSSTLWRILQRGELPSYKIGGFARRISLAALQAYITSCAGAA